MENTNFLAQIEELERLFSEQQVQADNAQTANAALQININQGIVFKELVLPVLPNSFEEKMKLLHDQVVRDNAALSLAKLQEKLAREKLARRKLKTERDSLRSNLSDGEARLADTTDRMQWLACRLEHDSRRLAATRDHYGRMAAEHADALRSLELEKAIAELKLKGTRET